MFYQQNSNALYGNSPSELQCHFLLMRNRGLREVPVAQTGTLAKAMRKNFRPTRVIELPDDDSCSIAANNEILRLQHAVSFLRPSLESDRSGGTP